jgi:hypothetical protein
MATTNNTNNIKVYVDVDSATWGDASNLMFATVDQETIDALHNMSDSEIREWAESVASR